MENKSNFILESNTGYDLYMDKEVIALCNTINALPGIKTFSSCSGHNKESVRIFFEVGNSKEGLFFLTRCVDSRYWKFGGLWKLELCVGDVFENDKLPIYYLLTSQEQKGEEAYKQIESLIENMNYHINHSNFLDYYRLDINKFQLK